MLQGHIYILSNPSMPGLVKIGRTHREVSTRMNELNSTGVPTPFKLVYSCWSSNCIDLETHIHAQIAGSRMKGREFFRLSPDEAIDIVENAHRQDNPTQEILELERKKEEKIKLERSLKREKIIEREKNRKKMMQDAISLPIICFMVSGGVFAVSESSFGKDSIVTDICALVGGFFMIWAAGAAFLVSMTPDSDE